MNKLSGYRLFRLSDGTELEMKFANGTYEIFAGLIGVAALEDIDAALQMPVRSVTAEDGSISQVPYMTLAYMRNFKMYVLAAVKYAALVQNKREVAGTPIDEINEWQVAEWIEELGYEQILSVIPKADMPGEETKKKPKTPLLKASQ